MAPSEALSGPHGEIDRRWPGWECYAGFQSLGMQPFVDLADLRIGHANASP